MPTTSYDAFEIETLTPHIGAEVRGLDLSRPLDEVQEMFHEVARELTAYYCGAFGRVRAEEQT